MKTLRPVILLFLALSPLTLSSCSLVQSATKLPGGLIKAVARTAGMNVPVTLNHPPHGQEQAEVVGNGAIQKLD